MIFLSNAALRYAVDICLEKDKYKVGIAIFDEDKRAAAHQFVYSMVSDSDYVENIRNSKYNFEVHFKNGSAIKFVYPSDNARGHRFHLLIEDKDNPKDSTRVLRACEILEGYVYFVDDIDKLKKHSSNANRIAEAIERTKKYVR